MSDNITLTQSDLIQRLLDGAPSGYDSNILTPNAKFTKPEDSKWLRVTVVPFETDSRIMCDRCILSAG